MEIISNVHPRSNTPLKRPRLPLDCNPQALGLDQDADLMDNMRLSKRFLSQSMAADLGRLNMLPASQSPETDCAPGFPSDAMQIDRERTPTGSPTQSSPGEAVGAAAHCEARNASSAGVSSGSRLGTLTRESMCFGTPNAQSRCRATPSGARGGLGRGMPCHMEEKAPTSPSDGGGTMDLRKTALIRSLLLCTGEKTRASALQQEALHPPSRFQRRPHRSGSAQGAGSDVSGGSSMSMEGDACSSDCESPVQPLGATDISVPGREGISASSIDEIWPVLQEMVTCWQAEHESFAGWKQPLTPETDIGPCFAQPRAYLST
eukprot:jgi/Astpho2/2368/Aster-x1071